MSLATDLLRKLNQPPAVKPSPVRGVTFHKGSKLWHVKIMKNYVRHFYGCFKTREEAERVAIQRRKELNERN